MTYLSAYELIHFRGNNQVGMRAVSNVFICWKPKLAIRVLSPLGIAESITGGQEAIDLLKLDNSKNTAGLGAGSFFQRDFNSTVSYKVIAALQ